MYLKIWEFRKATKEEKKIFKKITPKTNWYNSWDLAYNIVDQTYIFGTSALPWSFEIDYSPEMHELNQEEFDRCGVVNQYKLIAKSLPQA